MKRLIVVLSASIGLLAASPAAQALARSGPPALVVVYHHTVVDRTGPISYCWTFTDASGGGSGLCADGIGGYGDAARVHAPAWVALRFPYAERPTDVTVWAAARVRGHGYNERSIGAHRLAVRLVPHRVHGEIRAWDARIRLAPGRHYYLDVGADWREGDAGYRLHLLT